jgi:hypothetical protein
VQLPEDLEIIRALWKRFLKLIEKYGIVLEFFSQGILEH